MAKQQYVTIDEQWVPLGGVSTGTGTGSSVIVAPEPPPLTGVPDGTLWVDEDSNVPPFTGPTGHTVQDEGTPLTTRAGLNFTGAGVTATDDAANDRTTINIPGSAGGGATVTVGPTEPASPALGDIWFKTS